MKTFVWSIPFRLNKSEKQNLFVYLTVEFFLNDVVIKKVYISLHGSLLWGVSCVVPILCQTSTCWRSSLTFELLKEGGSSSSFCPIRACWSSTFTPTLPALRHCSVDSALSRSVCVLSFMISSRLMMRRVREGLWGNVFGGVVQIESYPPLLPNPNLALPPGAPQTRVPLRGRSLE